MEIKQIRLNTLENTRKSYARILRAYNKDELSENKFRNLCYGLSGYLSYFKLIKDLDIEKDIKEIKETLARRING